MPGRPALPGLCIIRSSLNSSHDICEPRGVMISGTVYDHLQGKLDLPLSSPASGTSRTLADRSEPTGCGLTGHRRHCPHADAAGGPSASAAVAGAIP